MLKMLQIVIEPRNYITPSVKNLRKNPEKQDVFQGYD